MKIEPNNIYCGDCYELIKDIPDKSVDLVIIDPPYKMDSGGTGHKEMAVRFHKRYQELKDLKLDVGMDFSLLDELERVCKYIYIYMVQQKLIVRFNSKIPPKRRCQFRFNYLGKN